MFFGKDDIEIKVTEENHGYEPQGKPMDPNSAAE